MNGAKGVLQLACQHRIGGCHGSACRAQRRFQGVAIDGGIRIHLLVLRPAGDLLLLDKQLTREAAAPSSKAPLQDLLTLDLGALGKAQYLRDLGGAQPQVLRGSISVGAGEAPDLPAAGVAANARLDHIDVDAWEKLAEALAGSTQELKSE